MSQSQSQDQSHRRPSRNNSATYRIEGKGVPVPATSTSPVPFLLPNKTTPTNTLQQVALQRPSLRKTGLADHIRNDRLGSPMRSGRVLDDHNNNHSSMPQQQSQQESTSQSQEAPPSSSRRQSYQQQPAISSRPMSSTNRPPTTIRTSSMRGPPPPVPASITTSPTPQEWNTRRLSKTGSDRQLWGTESASQAARQQQEPAQQNPHNSHMSMEPARTSNRDMLFDDQEDMPFQQESSQRQSRNDPPRQSQSQSQQPNMTSNNPAAGTGPPTATAKKKKKRPPGHIEKDGTPYWKIKLKKKIAKGKIPPPVRPGELPLVTNNQNEAPVPQEPEEERVKPLLRTTPSPIPLQEREEPSNQPPVWAQTKLKSIGHAEKVVKGMNIKSSTTARSTSTTPPLTSLDDTTTPYQRNVMPEQSSRSVSASVPPLPPKSSTSKARDGRTTPQWLQKSDPPPDTTLEAEPQAPQPPPQQSQYSSPQQKLRSYNNNYRPRSTSPWQQLYDQQEREKQRKLEEIANRSISSPTAVSKKQVVIEPPSSPFTKLPPRGPSSGSLAESTSPAPPISSTNHHHGRPPMSPMRTASPSMRASSPHATTARAPSPSGRSSSPIWAEQHHRASLLNKSPRINKPVVSTTKPPSWAQQKPQLRPTGNKEAVARGLDIPSLTRPADYEKFVPQPFEDAVPQQAQAQTPPVETVTSPNDDDYSISGVSALTEIAVDQPPDSWRSLNSEPSWASGAGRVKLKSTGKRNSLWSDATVDIEEEHVSLADNAKPTVTKGTPEDPINVEGVKLKSTIKSRHSWKAPPGPVDIAKSKSGEGTLEDPINAEDLEPKPTAEVQAKMAATSTSKRPGKDQEHTITTSIVVTSKTNQPGGFAPGSDQAIPAAAAAAIAAAAAVNTAEQQPESRTPSPPWAHKLRPTGFADDVMKGIDIKSEMSDSSHRRASWQRPLSAEEQPFDEATRGRATSKKVSPMRPPLSRKRATSMEPQQKLPEPKPSARSSSLPRSPPSQEQPAPPKATAFPFPDDNSVGRGSSIPPPTIAAISQEENTVRAKPLWAAGRPSLKATGHADDVMRGIDIKTRSAFSPALTPRSTALQHSLNSLKPATGEKDVPKEEADAFVSHQQHVSPYRVALRSTTILRPIEKRTIDDPEKEEFLANLASNRSLLRRVSRTDSDLPSDEDSLKSDKKNRTLAVKVTPARPTTKEPKEEDTPQRSNVDKTGVAVPPPVKRVPVSAEKFFVTGTATLEDNDDGSKQLSLTGRASLEPVVIDETDHAGTVEVSLSPTNLDEMERVKEAERTHSFGSSEEKKEDDGPTPPRPVTTRAPWAHLIEPSEAWDPRSYAQVASAKPHPPEEGPDKKSELAEDRRPSPDSVASDVQQEIAVEISPPSPVLGRRSATPDHDDSELLEERIDAVSESKSRPRTRPKSPVAEILEEEAANKTTASPTKASRVSKIPSPKAGTPTSSPDKKAEPTQRARLAPTRPAAASKMPAGKSPARKQDQSPPKKQAESVKKPKETLDKPTTKEEAKTAPAKKALSPKRSLSPVPQVVETVDSESDKAAARDSAVDQSSTSSQVKSSPSPEAFENEFEPEPIKPPPGKDVDPAKDAVEDASVLTRDDDLPESFPKYIEISTDQMPEVETTTDSKSAQDEAVPVVVRRTKPKHCVLCNTEEKDDTKFKYCGKCRLVKYCSRSCQKKHWKVHKQVCCKQIQQHMYGA